jgi:thiol-disulfide isomerase/thioredoxin
MLTVLMALVRNLRFQFAVAGLVWFAALQQPALAGTLQEILAQHRGEIVVLNFWASWCEPCKAEIPIFIELQKLYESQGVQVLGISVDVPEDRRLAQRFAKRAGVNYPILYDGRIEQMRPLGLADSIPATAVFDRGGERRYRMIGEVTKEVMTSRIDWLMGVHTQEEPAELRLPAGLTPEHFREHEEGREHEEEETHKAGAGKGEEGSTVPS